MKDISTLLEEISDKTEKLKRQTERRETAASISADAEEELPSRVVFEMNGTKRTPEGIETFRSGSETLDLGFELPAQSLEWEIGEGKYRIRVQTEGPTSVTAEHLDGETLIDGRKTNGDAVLDVNTGAIRLTAGRPIVGLHVEQFTARSPGTVLLGPFEAKGWVSAKPKGHGQWTARVASNQIYDASFTTESGPSLTIHSQERWNGVGRGEPEDTVIEDGVAHDTMKRVKPQEVAPLSFSEEISAGLIHRGHEIFETEQTIRPEAELDYWRDLEDYATLTPVTTPGFERVIGRWAYAWGIPQSVDKAISLTTLEEVKTPVTSKGAYLVKWADPTEFEVEEGTYAATATPIPDDRTSLPPGTHAKAEILESPDEVFVEVEGTGLLRGIELVEQVPMGPEGLITSRTRDIEIPDGVGEQRPQQVISRHHT